MLLLLLLVVVSGVSAGCDADQRVNGRVHKGSCKNKPLWQCDLSTCVDQIYLQSKGLSGTIPSTDGFFSKDVSQLGLNLNQLSGTIPAVMGSLKKLTRLYLQSNILTGSIPSAMGSLDKLSNLVFGRGSPQTNRLSGAVPSAWCTRVQPAYLCDLKGRNTLCLPRVCRPALVFTASKSWCRLTSLCPETSLKGTGCPVDRPGALTILGKQFTCEQLSGYCVDPMFGSLAKQHCPKTCGTTCEDHSGPVTILDHKFTCHDLAAYCTDLVVGATARSYCPKTCCACSASAVGDDGDTVVVHGRQLRGA